MSQGGGGSWGPPQKFFCLNCVKSCNFRQNKHGNDIFMKPRDSVHDGRRGNPLNMEMIRIFQTFYIIYNTGERSEPEKNYKNKIKTTFGTPLLPIKYPHKSPPLTNLRGVRTPGPPPLWIRTCKPTRGSSQL